MPIGQVVKFQSDRKLDKKEYIWENEAMNILEELLEAKGYNIPKSQREAFLKPLVQYIRSKAATDPSITWNEPFEAEKADAFADIIVFSIGSLMKLNYDPEKVLLEVSKEINSRQGKIINGKFEKYLPSEPEYQETYIADFSKCKIC